MGLQGQSAGDYALSCYSRYVESNQDFDITVSHSVKVTLNDGNRLAFYIESSELKNWEFREVEGISVIDEQLAALHIDQYLRTIVGFTVGTGFKVKEESTQVVFYENQGLWVG